METVVALVLLFAVLSRPVAGQAAAGCGTGAIPSVIRVSAIPDLYFSAGPPQSGFLVDVLNAVQNLTGLSYVITVRGLNYSYGNQRPDGSYNGSLIGDLINNEADLIGTDLTVTSDRAAVVEYLLPFLNYYLVLLTNTQFGINADTQYVSIDNANLRDLKNVKNGTLNAIHANVLAGKPDSIVKLYNEGVAKVLSGNFAFVVEGPVAYRFSKVPENAGKLQFDLNARLGNFFVALAVQKGNPLFKVMNNALLKMNENGVLLDLIEKYDLSMF